MPRRRRAEIRDILADPIYNSTLVEKFVNSMMWDGKKSVAQGVFYTAMDKMAERGGDDALKLFKKAIENAKPLLEVAGKPMIEWVLDNLNPVSDLGTIYVVTNNKFAKDFQEWADSFLLPIRPDKLQALIILRMQLMMPNKMLLIIILQNAGKIQMIMNSQKNYGKFLRKL